MPQIVSWSWCAWQTWFRRKHSLPQLENQVSLILHELKASIVRHVCSYKGVVCFCSPWALPFSFKLHKWPLEECIGNVSSKSTGYDRQHGAPHFPSSSPQKMWDWTWSLGRGRGHVTTSSPLIVTRGGVQHFQAGDLLACVWLASLLPLCCRDNKHAKPPSGEHMQRAWGATTGHEPYRRNQLVLLSDTEVFWVRSFSVAVCCCSLT